MTEYQLRIHGGKNIQQSKETFDFLYEAVEQAEMYCTDDTEGWNFKNDKMVLVDYNNSDRQEDIVINTIKPIKK